LVDSNIGAAVDTVSHRNAATVAAGLDAWLADRWGGVSALNLHAPTGSGASSELFFVDIIGLPEALEPLTPAVLRLGSAWPVYPHEDLEKQAMCMTAAHRPGLPVPRVIAVATPKPPEFPVPFLLMERLTGRSAPDLPSYVLEGWIYDLSTAQQAQLWDNALQAVANLHEVEFGSVQQQQCQLPVEGETALERMLNYWRLYLELVEHVAPQPVLAESVAWLCANRPEGKQDEGLVWGDASLRNMLFRDLEVSAMLDFEFAHFGALAFDAAFFALMDHIMASGFANGAPRLPGFPGIHDTLDRYELLTGRRVADREFWLRTALTYSALSTTRVFQRMVEAGTISGSEIELIAPVTMLGAVLDGEPLPR